MWKPLARRFRYSVLSPISTANCIQMEATMTSGTLTRDELVERTVGAISAMADGTLDALPRSVPREAVTGGPRAEPPACRGRGPDAFWAAAQWLRAAFAELAFAV